MHEEITGVVLIAGEQGFVEVAGMPLIQRILLSGARAGLHEWILLAWHGAQRLHAALGTAAKLTGLSWRVYDVHNAAPECLNTILPASDVIAIACTAVFDEHLLLALQQEEGTTLCVTATAAVTADGVPLHDGCIPVGGSTPPLAHGFTGILRCSGARLAHVMAQAWGEMQQTSTPVHAMLPGLLASTPTRALDVSQHLWVPLVAPIHASVVAAEAQLVRRLGRQGDSLIVRLLNRRMSQALTKRLIRTAITPNQITLCSATLGLTGAYLLAQPTDLLQIGGSLCFLGSTIIDGCDGEVARLTFQESEFGGKLDLMMDNVVHLFLFPGIALGLYRETGDTRALVLGALSIAGVLFAFVVYLPALWRPAGKRRVYSRLHESLASRDFAYLLVILALVDRIDWFLGAAVVGTYVFAAAWLVLASIQRRREQRLTTGV